MTPPPYHLDQLAGRPAQCHELRYQPRRRHHGVRPKGEGHEGRKEVAHGTLQRRPRLTQPRVDQLH